MFSKAIRETPMTSSAANEYFDSRISGQNINGDNTFVATLRALIDPRLPDDGTLYFGYTRSNYNKDALEGCTERDAVKTICDGIAYDDNTIRVHNFCNTDGGESNRSWMDVMEKKFTSVYDGWARVEKVTTFYRNVFHALCYINPDRKSTILFVDLSTSSTPIDMRRMHYLQCGIFAFLPWYFDPSNGVTELEKELVNSLREKSEENYLVCLAKMAERYDFRTSRIKRLLAGFESRYERLRVDRVNSELNNIRRMLRTLDDQYADYLRQKRDYEATILGLKLKIAENEGESEIMDYFLTNRCLILKDVDDSTMTFVVKAPLDFIDEEMAERCINNNGSCFYDYLDRDGIYTRENIKMLMTEIFLTQRLKLNFCAAYRFRMEGGVQALKHYADYGDCGDYTPNPHIDRYECLGDYGRIINQCLQTQDYIGAIEQCIASCKSLNLVDSSVMNEFMRRITGRGDTVNMKCIVLPDGRIVKPGEAVAWLCEEKRQAAEAQETHEEA